MGQLEKIKPDTRLFERVSAFLGAEAGMLDAREWHEWLALFAPDARYWAPVWANDQLEARIFRIEGEDSYASMPLPQTSHVVTCTGAQKAADAIVKAKASWMVHYFWRTKGAFVRAGRHKYDLREDGDSFLIALKKIFIHDDRVVGPIDIYNI
jgi:3-phenylpropionate/cinnamic acid dioxygenase small subunit